MLKINFKTLIVTALSTLIFTVVPTTVHADDDPSVKNNIWSTLSTSQGTYDQLQTLHNGNQIYYHIQMPHKNPYYHVWQTAVNNWNKLGVIKLVQTSDANATMHLNGMYYHAKNNQKWRYYRYFRRHHINTQLLGNTTGNYNVVPITHNNETVYQLLQSDATLEPALWTEPTYMAIHTATHELGHCLGFGHDAARPNGRHLIMNAANYKDEQPLGTTERNLLLQHYGPFIDDSNN